MMRRVRWLEVSCPGAALREDMRAAGFLPVLETEEAIAGFVPARSAVAIAKVLWRHGVEVG